MKTFLLAVACLMIVAAVRADEKADVAKFNKDRDDCVKASKPDDIVAVGTCMLEKQDLINNGMVYIKDILDRMNSVILNKAKADEATKLIKQCWNGETQVSINDKDQLASIILCSFSVTKLVEEM